MKLIKKDCPLSIDLVPWGAGWTHAYLNVGNERIYFRISNVLGDQFSDLMRALYFLSSKQNDSDNADDIIDSKCAAIDMKTDKILGYYEHGETPNEYRVFRDIPFRASFTWDEEGSLIKWVLEREVSDEAEFLVKVHIEIQRDEIISYDYVFDYKELCYAVAKACTIALKEYGIWGYHRSTYHENINIVHFLYLKAVALDCLHIRETKTHHSENGDVSNLSEELELLLFDM